jgi:hypothetical protein
MEDLHGLRPTQHKNKTKPNQTGLMRAVFRWAQQLRLSRTSILVSDVSRCSPDTVPTESHDAKWKEGVVQLRTLLCWASPTLMLPLYLRLPAKRMYEV